MASFIQASFLRSLRFMSAFMFLQHLAFICCCLLISSISSLEESDDSEEDEEELRDLLRFFAVLEPI